MGWYKKIKIRPADKEFSLFVRTRDNWRCTFGFKCNRNIDFQEHPQGLSCCHFEKRRKETVRFDPLNADAGCAACHQYIDETPEGHKRHEEFKLNQLGEKQYNLLLFRANQTGHKDDFLTRIHIKQLMQELKQNDYRRTSP